MANYLINCAYIKEDANVIIKKIVSLYNFAQKQKESAHIVVNQVGKETFLEFLKVNLKKQDTSMRIFIKMMASLQKYFEDEIEVRNIKPKSAKQYEMNMIADFILRYLQSIERKLLKSQWKIMCILKAIEDDQLSLKKVDEIFTSHGIPSSFTLKFLFSTQVYYKKSNFIC